LLTLGCLPGGDDADAPATLDVAHGQERVAGEACQKHAIFVWLIRVEVLSLVFVPAVFAVMDDIGRLAWRLFSRFVGAADEPAASCRPSTRAKRAQQRTGDDGDRTPAVARMIARNRTSGGSARGRTALSH